MLLDGFHNDELVLLCEIQQADNYGKQIQLNGTDEMNSKPSKRSYLSRKTEYKIPGIQETPQLQTSICRTTKLSKTRLWNEDRKKQAEVTKTHILIIRK